MPDNNNKKVWDLWVVFLLLYTALYVPYQVCFVEESTQAGFVFDIIVDCSFFIDIILTFFTAQSEKNGTLIVKKSLIAKNYCKGWFFIDLLTTMPF